MPSITLTLVCSSLSDKNLPRDENGIGVVVGVGWDMRGRKMEEEKDVSLWDVRVNGLE